MNFLLTIILTLDIGPITATDGIAIRHCHAQDTALVEFVGNGWFKTRDTLLTLQSPPMSMLTNGTYVANIRTICRGATSTVTSVRFVISRPPPAPIVTRGPEVMPPLPPGFSPALPGATFYPTYADYLRQRADHRSN